MTNDDISCFLYFSVIPSKKSRCFWLSNSGGGMQNCERDLNKLLSGANVLEGVTFTGRSSGAPAKALQAWLDKLAL